MMRFSIIALTALRLARVPIILTAPARALLQAKMRRLSAIPNTI